MYKYIIITLAFLLLIFACWYNEPAYVQRNTCKIENLVDNPEALEKAIRNMGSGYNYTISPDGTLRVNKGDGVWLILKY